METTNNSSTTDSPPQVLSQTRRPCKQGEKGDIGLVDGLGSHDHIEGSNEVSNEIGDRGRSSINKGAENR